MTFDEVFKGLVSGKKIYRKSWTDTEYYLIRQSDDGPILVTTSGQPWFLISSEIFADDWEILDE